jgi:hypothetical protein
MATKLATRLQKCPPKTLKFLPFCLAGLKRKTPEMLIFQEKSHFLGLLHEWR